MHSGFIHTMFLSFPSAVHSHFPYLRFFCSSFNKSQAEKRKKALCEEHYILGTFHPRGLRDQGCGQKQMPQYAPGTSQSSSVTSENRAALRKAGVPTHNPQGHCPCPGNWSLWDPLQPLTPMWDGKSPAHAGGR